MSNTNIQNRIRFVTAASLFDGHDASINIIRRLLQSAGVEVIHLGHNRSVEEVVIAAIQEDVHGIAISSYQGGHMEYFKYMKDQLRSYGAEHIKIFGGGGGVIVPSEIQELEEYGIDKIFSPEDGRKLGLEGMIAWMIQRADQDLTSTSIIPDKDDGTHFLGLARMLSKVEIEGTYERQKTVAPPVLGITGTGGAGKSSLTDEITLRLLENNPEFRIGVLAFDPTRSKTGGALLGDRIRMNTPSLFPDRLYFRSFATRTGNQSVADTLQPTLDVMKDQNFDLIIVETAGIGQSDHTVTEISDISMYVMTAEFGSPLQLEKIEMLDYADLIAINKSEKQGSEDALANVKKQVQRNRKLFEEDVNSMPVYSTVASRFHDSGVNSLYNALGTLLAKFGKSISQVSSPREKEIESEILPMKRARYLSEVSDTMRKYKSQVSSLREIAQTLESLLITIALPEVAANDVLRNQLEIQVNNTKQKLPGDLLHFLTHYAEIRDTYKQDAIRFQIRDKQIDQDLQFETLSGLKLPLISLPEKASYGELTEFFYLENLPGYFPFTGGVFPFRKSDEAPTRMFAGEGGPEKTNSRFHYLTGGNSKGAVRLSTAFDSVTLYGADPETRPDIYGKIGNSGVNIATLDDCKRLYSGFDLSSPLSSVSMTINGPAPMLLSYFFNTAIDQAVEKYLTSTGRLEDAKRKIQSHYSSKALPIPEYLGELPGGHDGSGLSLLGAGDLELIDRETLEKIKADVLSKVRGTVQADILKEDQAQNTCIFSINFALLLMGDIQEFFVKHSVRNFYSVSISGYHMAEAGANPITQVAFTLANAFTYLEYYKRRGLKVDDFAPNFSFFFSNGLDAEYAVIGRVARRIWAVAMKELYGANERSQKLKYHIQTSGRSLHAMEIDFNDIRTTLQALYALYDNTNSLHTNAYDEAITTPTEDSVRRALAIQLIIQQELGLYKNQNVLQGSYLIQRLTQMVEDAVLDEFDRITSRGGVIGAMELMYQRAKIQEESMHYERLKHSGELPIMGVNTFLRPQSETIEGPIELVRSSDEEKKEQIQRVAVLQKAFGASADLQVRRLKEATKSGENSFSVLLDASRVCSLGQISRALYEVGGNYRRNI